MQYKNIYDFFKKQIPNKKAVFVFPSTIIARKWQETLIEENYAKTLPHERFIAWDIFKEEKLCPFNNEERPVNSIIRKLYAKHLIEENAKNPFLQYFIPREFAKKAQNFSEWFSIIFAELKSWKEHCDNRPITTQFASSTTDKEKSTSILQEESDLQEIYNRYSAFLKENRLFEPSWTKSSFQQDNAEYFIIFADTLLDFSEYERILKNEQSVTILNATDFSNRENINFCQFSDSRKQLKYIALKIEELHANQKIAYEDMAVSLSNIELDSFYLKKEFSLRNIPFTVLFGNALGKTFAGRFFSLVQECYTSNFSFDSVKALLLNKLIPWKEKTMAENLISWGISQHCVVSWKEGDSYFKTWEESFKNTNSYDQRFQNLEFLEEVKSWFLKLKQNITSLCLAPDFTTLETAYHIFREQMLDTTELTLEDNNTIARCVKEMQALEETVNMIPSLTPDNPFSIFVSHLDTCQYVKQQQNKGVSVFPFRVAAGAPFKAHFLMNASQAETTVISKKLDFLSERYKAELGILQTEDLSASFFDAYFIGSQEAMYFTFADETFSGSQIQHVFFSDAKPQKITIPQDPFFDENFSKFDFSSIYPVQKEGFKNWSQPNARKQIFEETFLFKPLESDSFFQKFVKTARFVNGLVKLSQSDLKLFHSCPARWVLDYQLSISELVTDSSLLDEKGTGTVVHKALEILFNKIKLSPQGRFSVEKKDEYYALLDEAVTEAISCNRELEGPLAKPLLEAITTNIKSKARKLLDNELDSFFQNGWKIIATEENLKMPYKELLLKGTIDKVFYGLEGDYADDIAIIDYKSGSAPQKKDCFIETLSGETNDNQISTSGELSDFQIPFYIWLYENSLKNSSPEVKVSYAVFNAEKKLSEVVSNNIGGREKKKTRDDFQKEIDLFLEIAMSFGKDVKTLRFMRPTNLEFQDCMQCKMKSVCRFAYSVK